MKGPRTCSFLSAVVRLTLKHRDFKLRLGEWLPVSVVFKTSHTALDADCPGNSGTKREVPFTKLILESHSLFVSSYVCSQVPKIIYTTGCLDTFEELIGNNVAAVGGVGCGVAFLQFIGIVFACLLARTIKKEYETV